MTDFDYFVLIVAIPIGLALVEIAQGLSSALRQRVTIPIGWMTPLLASFLILTTAAVWETLWDLRGTVKAEWLSIALGLFFALFYYLSASFIFPNDEHGAASLDDWFRRNRKVSLGGPLLLMLIFGIAIYLPDNRPNSQEAIALVVVISLYAIPALFAIFSSSKTKILISLAVLNLIWLLPAATSFA